MYSCVLLLSFFPEKYRAKRNGKMCLAKTQKTKYENKVDIQCLPDEEARSGERITAMENTSSEVEEAMEAQRERSCKVCQNEETRFRLREKGGIVQISRSTTPA